MINIKDFENDEIDRLSLAMNYSKNSSPKCKFENNIFLSQELNPSHNQVSTKPTNANNAICSDLVKDCIDSLKQIQTETESENDSEEENFTKEKNISHKKENRNFTSNLKKRGRLQKTLSAYGLNFRNSLHDRNSSDNIYDKMIRQLFKSINEKLNNQYAGKYKFAKVSYTSHKREFGIKKVNDYFKMKILDLVCKKQNNLNTIKSIKENKDYENYEYILNMTIGEYYEFIFKTIIDEDPDLSKNIKFVNIYNKILNKFHKPI